MKITLIGTAAGEAYPGNWCYCPNCRAARLAGGRNIRGNTCSMLDDDVLLDMNAHLFEAAPLLNLALDRITTLLVTHAHHDHFDPFYLSQRSCPPGYAQLEGEELLRSVSPCFSVLPVLDVFGNRFVREAVDAYFGSSYRRLEDSRFQFHEIHDGVQVAHGDLVFTPVRSIHTAQYGYCDNYILERGGQTLFYATDAGGWDEEMLEIIYAHTYDGVVLEGTFGLGAEDAGHMCLKKNIRFRNALLEHRCIRPETPFILTHICPHWTPLYDEYAEIVKKEGMILGYDGQVIQIPCKTSQEAF